MTPKSDSKYETILPPASDKPAPPPRDFREIVNADGELVRVGFSQDPPPDQ